MNVQLERFFLGSQVFSDVGKPFHLTRNSTFPRRIRESKIFSTSNSSWLSMINGHGGGISLTKRDFVYALSKETWNTGCIFILLGNSSSKDTALICLFIRNGPMNLFSSFWDGLLVRMFLVERRTISSILKEWSRRFLLANLVISNLALDSEAERNLEMLLRRCDRERASGDLESFTGLKSIRGWKA